jgi:TaqI-like C-terminal specificity domain
MRICFGSTTGNGRKLSRICRRTNPGQRRWHDATGFCALWPSIACNKLREAEINLGQGILINIPKGKVRIDDYPAIRDHLLAFKDKLEARATKQEWFELQQAQLAYQPIMRNRKLVWPHFQAHASFCMDDTGVFLNNKAFFVSDPPFEELGFLNSRPAWFLLAHLARIKRGGYLEAEAQYVGQLPSIASQNQEVSQIRRFAGETNSKAISRNQVTDRVLRRIPDLCPSGRAPKLTNRLREWWNLDFRTFQAEIKKAFKTDIPLKQRNEWENLLREEGEKVRRLMAEIEQAEREIDTIVYKLFDLKSDEIALLESSLAGQY